MPKTRLALVAPAAMVFIAAGCGSSEATAAPRLPIDDWGSY